MAGNYKTRIMMIAYGLLIATLPPLAMYLVFVMKIENTMIFYTMAGIMWVLSGVIAFKMVSTWEHSSHVIYYDEEPRLLDVLQNVHGDLTAFKNYFDAFFKQYKTFFGKDAIQAIYISAFENDSTIGFTKIDFQENESNQAVGYTIPSYADIVLQKTELIAPFLSTNRRALTHADIKHLADYSNLALPGTMIYPLVNDEIGVLGMWVLTVNEIDSDKSPALVISSARYVLEDILTIVYYATKKRKGSVSESHFALLYQQIVNLINVVLHEINTPLAIIKGNLMMVKTMKKMTSETFTQIDQMTDRISRRMTKMATYANAIVQRQNDTNSTMKVREVVSWLQQEYTSGAEYIAREKQNKVKISIEQRELYERRVVCNAIVLASLYEIMENCVLYSPPKHEVVLLVKYRHSPSGKDTINFVFKNYGTITPEVLETYKRLSTTVDYMQHSSNEKGMGIGLALSYTAITKSGGTLEITNQDKQTVTVDVHLPVE